MATLVVVPCGMAKIWDRYPDAGPTPARAAYTGSPFKVNREYAEAFADRWVILSAKYGFIEPGFIIPENYNVTFNDPGTAPICLDELRRQVEEKALDHFVTVVALGSLTYADKVAAAFAGKQSKVCAPTGGLPIGKMMGAVRAAIDSGRAFNC